MFFRNPAIFLLVKDKRKMKMPINTLFQKQAADIIIDLLNKDEILIKETVFDQYTDKKIFMFQLFSNNPYQEICTLQQILHNDSKKEAYIYIQAKEQKWSPEIVQKLIDIVIEKLHK